jgi:hypothetical protein
MSTHFIPTRERPTEYGQSADELAANRKCQREHRKSWVVIDRKCNYSAFNGYRRTRSRYSLLRCDHPGCRRMWRTDAAYVDEVPDARR